MEIGLLNKKYNDFCILMDSENMYLYELRKANKKGSLSFFFSGDHYCFDANNLCKEINILYKSFQDTRAMLYNDFKNKLIEISLQPYFCNDKKIISCHIYILV